MSLLERPIVLKLNSNWQRIGWTSPKKAFIDMCGGKDGANPPALALDITLDAKGNLESAVATKWTDWMALPVRPGDQAIQTKSGAVRCPTVLIAPNYRDMPLVAPALTNKAILERDGYVDQYTGEKLRKEDATVDHVIPKDRGGAKRAWENMVTCHRKRNHEKGNRLNEEVNLRLLKKPRKPMPLPKCVTILGEHHPEQAPF